MKTMLIIGLLFAALTIQAGNFFKFRFTRTDGTEWECLKVNHDSENPTQIGTNQPAIGTNMPSYGGHTYRIDTDNQVLVIDETHSVPLQFQQSGWSIQSQHGFAIDNSGVGWILSTETDEDNLDIFWTVSINSGEVTIIDFAGPYSGTPFRANGLIILQFP